MNEDTARMPGPDDITDVDFEKAVKKALEECDQLGIPRENLPENFGVSKDSFENWANGKPGPGQPARKGILKDIEEWRRKNKGRFD